MYRWHTNLVSYRVTASVFCFRTEGHAAYKLGARQCRYAVIVHSQNTQLVVSRRCQVTQQKVLVVGRDHPDREKDKTKRFSLILSWLFTELSHMGKGSCDIGNYWQCQNEKAKASKKIWTLMESQFKMYFFISFVAYETCTMSENEALDKKEEERIEAHVKYIFLRVTVSSSGWRGVFKASFLLSVWI